MSTGTDPSSSSAVVRDRRRRPWWIWLALAAVALLLLLLGLTQCVGGDGPATPGAAPSGAPQGGPDGATPAPAVVGGVPGAATGGAGTLTADGTALLPVAQAADANGSLAALVGKAVAAEGVTVQSVPANEGFWVGTGETDRVWVQLSGSGESGYVVQPGDRVSFAGTVVAHDAAFAGQAGVDPAEGAEQLATQGAHVEVAKGALRRS